MRTQKETATIIESIIKGVYKKLKASKPKLRNDRLDAEKIPNHIQKKIKKECTNNDINEAYIRKIAGWNKSKK